MSVIKYTLTEDEAANFHDDEFRSQLRSRLAVEYPDGVQVFNSSDDLIDHIGGSVTDGSEIEFAEVVDDEEAEKRKIQRETEAELEKQQIDYYESIIKPQVIEKIRGEVRQEFRDQLREAYSSIFAYRAKLASHIRESTESTAKLRRSLEASQKDVEQFKELLADEQARHVELKEQLAKAES